MSGATTNTTEKVKQILAELKLHEKTDQIIAKSEQESRRTLSIEPMITSSSSSSLVEEPLSPLPSSPGFVSDFLKKGSSQPTADDFYKVLQDSAEKDAICGGRVGCTIL
jgi:hypothetical protein